MIEKVGHVRNPLTIIAIFAALAEVGGTIVLPLLEPITQYIYVWFLMLFPIALVGAFFFVLYKKHHVLYAPSDFKEDTSFLDLLESQPPNDRLEAFAKETEEAASESEGDASESMSALAIMQRDRRAKYLLAEELAIAKITKDCGLKVRRSVAERGYKDGGFDGAAETDTHDFIIEVGYVRGSVPSKYMWRHKVERLTEFYNRIPDARKSRFRLMLVSVYEKDMEQAVSRMEEQLRELVATAAFPVEIKQYCFDSLADEFHLR